LANSGDALLETLFVTEDANFHSKIVDRYIHPAKTWKTNGVFLGRDDHVDVGFDTAVDEGNDFLLCEAVVIHEAAGCFYRGTEIFHSLLEAFGNSDRAYSADFFPLQFFERESVARFDVLEIAGAVLALDDLCGAVVLANALN